MPSILADVAPQPEALQLGTALLCVCAVAVVAAIVLVVVLVKRSRK
ncbi:hypothetical protein CS0771_49950 [Catellatospora sp. IY07-71]|nr:hypothetical protein [Catellatospora sp. IY07-71]BCJ75451.1 hypothetical protein CS0771_49950 [Catellatospora sp. IY07-71]